MSDNIELPRVDLSLPEDQEVQGNISLGEIDTTAESPTKVAEGVGTIALAAITPAEAEGATSAADAFLANVYSNWAMVQALGHTNGDHSAAEDLIQELARRVHEHQGLVKYPKAWIRTVLRNLAISRSRLWDIRSVHISTELVEVSAPAYNSHEQVIIDRGLIAVLMGILSPKAREAVELAYLADLPYSEIAPRLKVSEGGVKTIVRRALMDMREYHQTLQDRDNW